MDKKEECKYCIKHKTMYCPNSSECYSLNNLPHFKTNFDILRENDTLNKGINELIEEYTNRLNIKQIPLIGNFQESNIPPDIHSIILGSVIQDLRKLKGE